MINISTYLNRITSEHKTKPKFMELVKARLTPFIDLFECLEKMSTLFDLDTAVGNQLDILGEYIGVKRQLNFQPQFANSLLPDAYYRILLKAQISLNNWDGTIDGIKKLWRETFPDYEIQVIDNQNMTMETRIIGLQSLFESELIQHGYITPKPIGVQVKYSVIIPLLVNSLVFIGGTSVCKQLHRSIPTTLVPVDGVIPLDFI